MPESLYSQMTHAIRTSAGLYYRLVVLVDLSSSEKIALRQQFNDFPHTYINVNAALSQRLINLTLKQRIVQLPKILAEFIMANNTELIVLDNLELLCEVELQQDPLRLLQQIARNRTIVAAWPGRVEGHKLIYAEPGHPEYREYEAKELLIVSLNSPPGPLS